jgi:hypothetical protein
MLITVIVYATDAVMVIIGMTKANSCAERADVHAHLGGSRRHAYGDKTGDNRGVENMFHSGLHQTHP